MDGVTPKVLIIDDESISEIIDMYLKRSGYSTKIVSNGKEAQKLYLDYNPDIVLVMIPYIDGIDILKWIRKQKETPVIMITAKGDTFDKILALEIGADDYIVKPFEPKELLARIKAVLRRCFSENVKSEIIKLSDLLIDSTSYKVTYNAEEIKMPPKEFELLYYLANNKNKVFTRKQLLCKVWGYEYPGDSRTVDVHIKRLREKLSNGEQWGIETVWGVGYKFKVN